MKKLTELALDISEVTYRAFPAISYSIISGYIQKGFKSLYEEKQTNSGMNMGTLLDILLTGDEKDLGEKIAILDTKIPSDNIKLILDKLVNVYVKTNKEIPLTLDINNVDMVSLIKVQANIVDYGQSWKPETLVNKIITEGNDYYTFMVQNINKLILSRDLFEEMCDLVVELKNNEYTKQYFEIVENVEFYDQLKFHYEDEYHNVKCMFDRLIVNHADKTIRPIDFKITNEGEEKFEVRLLKFNYYIQATLYSYILQKIIERDAYYHDFTILPFSFIVIDPDNQTPIVYEFPIFSDDTILIDKYGNKLKSWKSYYSEIMYYKSLPNMPRYSKQVIECKGHITVETIKPLELYA